MSYKGHLSKQLFFITGMVFVTVFLLLGIVLPKTLIPVAEKNIYSRLSEPLRVMQSDFSKESDNSLIAYLYIVDGEVVNNDNLDNVIKIDDTSKLSKYIKNDYGKFIYKHRTYYYYKLTQGSVVKIALTGDDYIQEIKGEIITAIFPIILLTFILISLILLIWSSIIVIKIEKLKNAAYNIDNPDYDINLNFKADDELKSLGLAIEDMSISLRNQEKYRNQMYQNISHDFKTPLAVIKSYIEAVDDDVEDSKTALKVIKEQALKLENKVLSLLYLNKLDYLKDTKVEIVQVDMEKLIKDEVDKFKWKRKDITFKTSIDSKSKYYGTEEHWETIIDNLLNNFMRYAEKEIKITARGNKLILYNDGSNIDNELLEGIFTPFRKGIKGEFGLGLSIVKKTLNIIGYDIVIKNEKKGVSFIMTKISK